MSHFTVLVVLPKEGLQRYENETIHKGDDEWQNAYNHQWFHPQLEEAMLPYYEQHEADSEYMERDIQLNETATKVWRAFVDRDWETLAELHFDRRQLIEKWERNASVSDLKTEILNLLTLTFFSFFLFLSFLFTLLFIFFIISFYPLFLRQIDLFLLFL